MFSIAVKLTNTNLPVIRLCLGAASKTSTAVVKSIRFNVVQSGKKYTLILTIILNTGNRYQLTFQWNSSHPVERKKDC